MLKRVLFLSLRPKYAEKILQGTKTVELRRARPSISEGDKVVLYVTSPTKAVKAISTVEDVHCARPDQLWRKIKDKAGITHAEFEEYFEGAQEGVAIHIKDVQELARPVTLSTLRKLWPNFSPPQSYLYFSDKQLAQLMKAEAQ
jgi:predicted transcriptional regulator